MPSRPLYYVVDWLPPDFGAVGQYALFFARQLAEDGRRVCLVGLTTGRPGVDKRSFAGGGELEIKRLAARPYDKSRSLARTAWTLRVNARLTADLIRRKGMREADVLFTGSPPFMLFFAMLVKAVRRPQLVYRITDFHPETLVAELGHQPWLLRVLLRLTWALRRRVDRFEVLGEDQRRILLNGRIPAHRIVLKRDVPPVAISGMETPVDRPPELRGYRVLLYSGNYGVAHDVDTVVEGLVRHHRDGTGTFALWLNASGSKIESLAQRLRRAGVPFVHSDPVDLDILPRLLAAADVHLITLRPQFAGIVLPSKVYGCIASRRPILFVGPEVSDVHLLARRSSNPYQQVEPGCPKSFCEALESLSDAARGRTDAARAS